MSSFINTAGTTSACGESSQLKRVSFVFFADFVCTACPPGDEHTTRLIMLHAARVLLFCVLKLRHLSINFRLLS